MTLDLLLTGRAAPDLVTIGQVTLAQETAAAFCQLQQAAAGRGFDLQLVSGYRNFQRQAAIWNAKLSGARPVFDLAEQQVSLDKLAGIDKLTAVLLYSALPGASRHHWGTDLDLYDRAAVASDYQPQLLVSEYDTDGPFHPASQWLAEHAHQYGFFLPYRRYQGGVAAEPWHLSYRPLAESYLASFRQDMLANAIEQSELLEKSLILEHLPTLFQRYVMNICEVSNGD